MKRIIFVDDDGNVLEGLRRLLYPLRAEWQMSFASSGQEALEIMSRDAIDVVITDIRMPGMDGIELLAQVRKLHPEAVRIVLSGQSDRDLTLKSAATAHQYLSKPCDTEALKLTIARAISLKNSFEDKSLQALVSGIKALPSVPALYTELVKELERPESSMQDIANVIRKDTAMTAKILQLANSAFFGIRRRITNPKEAVLYLGLDTLRALVMSVKVFSQFAVSSKRFSIGALANHGLLTGVVARKIAQMSGSSKQVVEDALMAGLLHDVGILVLVQAFPQKYDDMLKVAEATRQPLWEAERDLFGTTHAEVGTYLLWLWGMPDPVVEAVAYHHAPSRCPVQAFGVLTAVHVADVLADANHGDNDQQALAGLDVEYLTNLGVWENLPAWRRAAENADQLHEVI